MKQLLTRYNAFFKCLIPLTVGFCCVLLVFALYKALNPSYPPYVIERSKLLQMPLPESKEIDSIHTQVANGVPPSDQQWEKVKNLLESDNTQRQQFGLLILGGLYKTKYRQDAIRFASSLVNSPASNVQATAITVLAKMHDSRWKEYALKNRDHPDVLLRQNAERLLARQERFR